MKYGDLLLVFLGILLIAAVGYTLGVDNNIWYLPTLLAVFFFYFLYELKFEKKH